MIHIGIIGCGGFAGHHARQLSLMQNVQLAALCDVSEEITRAFTERNVPSLVPAPFHFCGTREFFAEGNLDAVIITSPHMLHYQHACEALAAGCHIFVEKPMVTDSAQARNLAARVAETGKILVIGYNTACSPEFNYLRRCIRDNTFGRLELVNGYLSQNWKKGTTGKWRQVLALSGGGQAYDSGAHLFNSLVWTVEAPVAEVFAFVDKQDREVDINSVTAIKFENGVLASIVIGGNSASGAGSHMVFVFEEGRVEINGWFGDWIKVWDNKGAIKYPLITDQPMTPLQNFIASIEGQDTPRTTPLNGIHQSQLMDAIYASATSGRPVRPSELNSPEQAQL